MIKNEERRGPTPRKSGGPEGLRSKGGGPKCRGRIVGPRSVGARRVGERRRGAQNFALFLPSPAHIFALVLSLWGSSRGILVVFEAPGPLNVHVWALGLSCETPDEKKQKSKHLKSNKTMCKKNKKSQKKEKRKKNEK